NVEYFDIDRESGFNISAGVRIHGRSTRNNAQKTLAIFTREKYGYQTIPYKIYSKKSPETMNTFILRNGGNDWGITMFLDGLNHTLVIDKIDIDAQLYQPAILLLNGKYWGIHNIREKINKHYIKNKHHIDSTKIDIIETDGIAGKIVASSGNLYEYNKMIEFIENNDLSVKENYDTIKKWIDINEFINYLAIQVYICNRDWPRSNMKFWKERGESGKWRWILYDTETSYKESNILSRFDMLEHMLAENSDYYATTPWSNYLIRKLFESDEFKFEFIQRMAVYLNTVFDSDHVLYVLDSLKRNIEPEIKRHTNKWGKIRQNAIPFLLTSENQSVWEANIKFVKVFIENRPSIIRKNIVEYFNLKDTVNLKLSVSDNNAGRISLMGYTPEENNFDGYIFADIPIRMEAIPNKGYEFVKWKGADYEKKCVFSLKKNKKLTAVFQKIE
ncbi:CotH kinase family protein, partial [Bacteroidota bacterium]